MEGILVEIRELLKSHTELSMVMLRSEEPVHADKILTDILEILKSWRMPAISQMDMTYDSTNLPTKKVAMNQNDKLQNQYDKLLDWLDKLVDLEFRNLMRSMLPTHREQNLLEKPLPLCDRGTFLGHIQARGRLDELELYLIENYQS
jgi:hypothetical protein